MLARNTRSTQLTEEGQRLLARIDEPLAEIEAGFSELIDKESAPAEPLRLTMPTLVAEDVIMPRVAAFLERYPAIELDIRTHNAFADLVETGCDAGLQLGEYLSPDMIAVKASGPLRDWVVAARTIWSATARLHTRAILRRTGAFVGGFQTVRSIAGNSKRTGRK